MAMLQKMTRFMSEKCYTHTEEWLTACVQWIQENFPNVSEVVAKQQVFEQWIDTNLEQLGSVCLPPNLSCQKCISLQGKYALQMNCVQDIGESAYNQWKRIKKLENENTDVTAARSTDNSWAPAGKRCLYLTLTDGSQTVYGLEMSSINVLSLNLKPGVKVLISGPVECRRGVLQLRSANIQVIGGEVECLAGSHCVEALLSDRLNIPRNTQNNATVTQPSQYTIHTAPTQIITSTADNDGFPNELDDEDDLLFMEIDENLLLGTSPPPIHVETTTPPIHVETTYPINVSSRPYVYIKQIKENLDRLIELGNNLHVKACVATVISNIEVANGSWTLTVSINDGTGFLNCKLSSELLNRIIGFDPVEMKRLKNLKTPIAKQQISQGMKELTSKLVHLNVIVEVQLGPEPIIVNFTDVYMHHVNAVKHRISVLQT